MSIKSETYSATFFSQLIGADRRTVEIWCKNGPIKAKKHQNKREWAISYDAMVNFLHQNPRYLERMKEKRKKYLFYAPRKSKLYESIIEELDSRVKIFSVRMLADRLNVECGTVLYWVEKEKILPLHVRSASRDVLFTETEVLKFLDQNLKYKDIWDDNVNQEL